MVKSLSLIVPAFNEEEIIESSTARLTTIMQRLIKSKKISSASRILFVDDGSTDKTWSMLENIHKKNAMVDAIKFSRNFGHQNALIAGLTQSKDYDYTVTIDADLQDDPDKIEDMVDLANNGTNIVFGVRDNRDSDSWFKRNSAGLFYSLMNLMGAKTIKNAADFRLIDKRALTELLKYHEHDMFLRGIVTGLGFKTAQVTYARTPRTAGTSKYPFFKMIQFSYNGLVSFSLVPIRLVRNIGFGVAFIGILYLLYTIYQKFTGTAQPGWPSLIVSIWLIGGIILVSLGIVGEYIGSIFNEVKNRPRYIIEDSLDK